MPDGEDLLSLSNDEPIEGDDLDAVVRAVSERGADASADARDSGDVDTPSEPIADETEVAAPDADTATDPDIDADPAVGTDEPAPAPESATEPSPRKRRQRRASVPSWDEIMFGKNGSTD